jgi:hypothetical protein
MALDGIWYNELNSRMELTVKEGLVQGTYETAVSGKGCAKGKFQLAGRADTARDGVLNVGFVVSWENDQSNCESVTAWSGEYRTTRIGGEDVEILKTTWLLTLETNETDDWKSTLVGQDVFTRRVPAERELRVAQAMKRRSHPA